MIMTNVQAFLYKLFGASWFLSLLGYVVMIGGVVSLVQESIATDGIPTNMGGWLALAVGIGQRMAKQANVTNSPHPLAVAQPVVAEVGSMIAVPPVPLAKP